ncbi:MAG TPA: bifunctional DNA primase/polymerase [Gemmataceae bacterium]|nr:bifunctional DNA primase/polymerase [Gemmataceae bacterium]
MSSITSDPYFGKENGDLLATAWRYYKLDLCVFPLVDKVPACRWGRFQRRRPGRITLEHLFAGASANGIAAVTGRHGFGARDFDTHAAYLAWARQHPDLADCLPTVETRRGFHVHFTGPQGYVRHQVLGDGEYIAHCGHYVAMPPSEHPAGGRYRWVIPPNKRWPAVSDPHAAGLLPPGVPLRPRLRLASLPPTPAAASVITSCVNPPSEEDIEALIEQAILDTLPTGPSMRHDCVFDYVRRLKAIPGLEDSQETQQWLAQRWFRSAYPFIGTRAPERTERDFLDAWKRCRCPYGMFLPTIFVAARASPDPSVRGNARLGILAAACRHLHELHQGRPFFLSCRDAGELLGVSRQTALKDLQRLEALNCLRMVNKGHYKLKGSHATEWLFTGPGTDNERTNP